MLAGLVAVTASAHELRMVSHKGRKLAFYVTPGRLPPLVLDAGGGLDASYWNPLVPVLAKKTGSTIITYDRAGMGLSDEVPGPWKPQHAVSDLKAGLRALGVPRDVVLVSHSLAGEIATYLARSGSHWVAGAVLVDASLPNFYTDSMVSKLIAANEQLVAELQKQPSTRATRQLLAVAADYGPVHRAYHKVAWPQRVPAMVIVSAETPFPADPVDAQLWRDAQAEFVSAASKHRQLVVAARSSHDVPIDRPDVVVWAVQDILKKVAY